MVGYFFQFVDQEPDSGVIIDIEFADLHPKDFSYMNT